MSTFDQIDALRAQQGWDDTAMRALAETYIRTQYDDVTFLDFLHQQAARENDRTDPAVDEAGVDPDHLLHLANTAPTN